MNLIDLLIKYYYENTVEFAFIIHLVFAIIFYFKGGGKKIFKWPIDDDFIAFEYFAGVAVLLLLGRIIGCL